LPIVCRLLLLADNEQQRRSLRKGQGSFEGANDQPVRDPVSGVLHTEPGEINACWARHYRELLRDPHPLAQRVAIYRAAWEHRHGTSPPIAPALNGINGHITWEELVKALRRLKNNKAQGQDGITAEALKLAIYAPNSHFGKALLALINGIWTKNYIPQQWRSSAIVSVPKKGDATVMDNYRGISIIGAAMKLLMTIISQRLQDVCQAKGIIRRWQAGFMRNEEGPMQVASLFDIAARRQAAGLPTYAGFIDFRKAYDTVPHELLFLKPQAIGVTGHMLTFIKTLYRDSMVRVKTGVAPGTLSDPIPIERGLRQGCPASPILFNIFINDIFDGVEHLGCDVPGCTDTLAARQPLRVPGQLYADDAVGITGSFDNLHAMFAHFSQWAEDHFMGFGVLKCGVMALGRYSDETALREQAARWQLGGERVPVVNEYRYLGTVIKSDLGMQHIVDDRVKKGKRAIEALDSVLVGGRDIIPINVRVSVFKTCVLPVLTYGCEVWGMDRTSGANKLQTVLNQCLRCLIGVGKNSPGVATAPMMRELDIAPIEATAAAARARAFLKASDLNTCITHLVDQPSRARPNTWTSGTVRWLDRLARANVGLAEGAHLPLEWRSLAARDAAKLVKASVWARYESSVSLARNNTWGIYVQASYASNPLPQYGVGVPAGVVAGLHIMIQLRTRVFPTARRLARIHAMPERFLEHCPACGGGESETIEHMLVECPRWGYHRHNFGLLVPEFRDFISSHVIASTPEDLTAFILGGVPPSLHGALAGLGMGKFSSYGVDGPSLTCIALPKCFAPRVGACPNSHYSNGLTPKRVGQTFRGQCRVFSWQCLRR